MQYIELCEIYQHIENTTKRLDKTYYLTSLLKKTPAKDVETVLLLLQGKLYHAWEEEVAGVAARLLVKAIAIATGLSTEEVENKWRQTGDLGLTAEQFVEKKKQKTLFSQSLTTTKVMSNLKKLATFEGVGTVDKKVKLIAELLTSAEPVEARYIIRLVIGDLRVGVGDSSIRDALVWAYLPLVIGIFVECEHCKEYVFVGNCTECRKKTKKAKEAIAEHNKQKTLLVENIQDVKNNRATLNKYRYILPTNEKIARQVYTFFTDQVQHAIDMSNDFAVVAEGLKKNALAGLDTITLQPGKPVKVMLAQRTRSVKEALGKVGTPAQFEYKYDGFRMLISKKKNNVTLHTRRLENVTKQFPEVVTHINKHITASSCILDTEAVGINPKTRKYFPFQHISQRIRRKYGIEQLAKELPVEINVFDMLYYDGESTLQLPFKKRRKLIEKVVEKVEGKIRPAQMKIINNEKEGNEFYQKALDEGNEGAMAKKLDAPYKPGSRVGFMVKIKPVMETIDAVIVEADWGHGKRANWLTSLTLACVDNGQFLKIGKVGTGMKEKSSEVDAKKGDVSFPAITELLTPLIIKEKGKHVHVKPKVVIEIKFEEIQKSPTYGSGFALRFPRVVRLRTDRLADEASTLDDIKELYEQQ